MKNRKIAFYIPALYKGGSERVLLNLAEYFARKGYAVKIVTDQTVENEYDVPEGIERIVLIDTAKEKYSGYKAISRFRKFCGKEKIDVVISFLNIYHAILATICSKTKCVISVRNDPGQTYKTAFSKIKNSLLFPFASLCVFQTEDAKNHFKIGSKAKSVIIENPVKDEFFDYNYKGNTGVIVTFGRLIEQKNQRLLIDAFSDVVKIFPDATLKIYGGGHLYNKLLSQIKQAGLEGNAFLCGQTNDVAGIMSNSTVFVLPSLFEGMPNALMEAMAVGMPCVATDCPCGGSRVLLKDDCGILVENENKEELANAIISLLSDSDLRTEYSSRARRKATQYTSESIFKKWQDYIGNL